MTDGLTDTERESLMRWRNRNYGELFEAVEQIKADAYRQGRADLAAKVEAVAHEWDFTRRYPVYPKEYAAQLRAVLATDSPPPDERCDCGDCVTYRAADSPPREDQS